MRGSLAGRLRRLILDSDPTDHRVLTGLLVTATVVILVSGLWPFRFVPPNNAGWAPGTNALHFPGGEARSAFDPGGAVLTPKPLAAGSGSDLTAGEISIELWVRPSLEPSGASGRIVSLSEGAGIEHFFIGQWSTQLLILVRKPLVAGTPRYQEYDLRDAFKAEQPRFVTVTSDREGTSIYLDGRPSKRLKEVRLMPTNETIVGSRIILGNSPKGTTPWAGDIFGLSVFGRSLSEQEVADGHAWWMGSGGSPPPIRDGLVALYSFRGKSGVWISNDFGPENPLVIPEKLPKKQPVIPRFRFAWRDTDDVVLNIAGFIPYGFFLVLWLVRARGWFLGRAGFAAVALGTLVSLFIECTQIFMPMRESSWTDLICNAGGTVLGVLAARWVRLRGKGKSAS